MNFRFLRPALCAMLCIPLFLSLPPAVQGAEQAAQEISGREQLVSLEGAGDASRLFDGHTTYGLTLRAPASVTLEDPRGIGSAYLIFDTEYGPYTVTDPDRNVSRTFGEQNFLHEFLDIQAAFGYAPRILTFSFSSGDASINELYLFTPGSVPDFVQKWRSPKEGATDLLLFSAHGDDEHLFFAGLLPDYAAQRGYETLVVYLTNHRNMTTLRCHEMLDGLWSVGVTTYPVFGPFGDYFCQGRDQAYALHRNNGQSEEALVEFVVEQLRRFRPQVAVGHDVDGEYGHGQHKMCADLLCKAVEKAGQINAYPDLAAKYGTWQVPKTYLHLWPENPITLDFDQTLPRFDGMTAFQVSTQLGFSCHKSQAGGITHFITGYPSAGEIPRYSPCEYGLYRTTVGEDTGKQDLFEHLISYDQQQAAASTVDNLKNTIRSAKTAHVQAAARKKSREAQQELHQIQQKMEALSRREAALSRWRRAAVLTAFSCAALLFFILRQGRKNKSGK